VNVDPAQGAVGGDQGNGGHCQGGCPIGSLASELSERDPANRHALATGFDRWETGIRAGLKRMRDRGELRADADPAALALATLAALQGGGALARSLCTVLWWPGVGNPSSCSSDPARLPL
jgi:hypothetical protein